MENKNEYEKSIYYDRSRCSIVDHNVVSNVALCNMPVDMKQLLDKINNGAVSVIVLLSVWTWMLVALTHWALCPLK